MKEGKCAELFFLNPFEMGRFVRQNNSLSGAVLSTKGYLELVENLTKP